jgi:hypothetical protein
MEEMERKQVLEELGNEKRKTILDWGAQYAVRIMVAGFCVLGASAISFYFIMNHPGFPRIIALYCGFGGFGIYMVGRLFLMVERANKKKMRETSALQDTNGDAA